MTNNPFWRECAVCGRQYNIDYADKHQNICPGAVD